MSLSPPLSLNQNSWSFCMSAARWRAARLRPPFPLLSMRIWPEGMRERGSEREREIQREIEGERGRERRG